ncbi:DUF5988 family protein [Amycolatopsis benzoatilytica]|uniref:DUF5988 family protein n=1 Tax=Amycolatopsis benzoatilytica TaxID=346045 RepID=UPI00047FE416|nr:DUF5988 family protein [Amycolatopsis benzoatilytica]
MAGLRIVLTGGPEQVRQGDWIREVDNLHDKVKIMSGSGYEHFSHNGEVVDIDGVALPVFHWCGTTKIAE